MTEEYKVYASEEYVDNAIKGIEIGGGSTNEEWKLLIDVTIPEENASVTLFVDKDSEGKPFRVEEVNIVWQGIQVTDGTKDGKAWISFNPTKAGYNAGKLGTMTNGYFYYTSQNNYTNGIGIRWGKGALWKTETSSLATMNVLNDLPNGITSIEVSAYQQKSFYGRVVIYGR